MKSTKATLFLKNRQFCLSVLSAVFLFFTVTATAATITWTGATTGGDWSIASNWSGSAVPAATDSVLIASPNEVTITTNVGKINKLAVQGKLIVGATGVLVIEQNTISTALLEIGGGEVSNAGSITLTQKMNNAIPGLSFVNGTAADGKFTNTGTFVINTSAGTGDCVTFYQTTTGSTAHLNLGGTLSFTPAASKYIIRIRGGYAQIDGTAVFGSVNNYQDFRLMHISAGVLTLAATANLTSYTSKLTNYSGTIHIDGTLINNGLLTMHSDPANTLTSVYGLYLNPTSIASACTFTNYGTVTIDGSYSGGSIYFNTFIGANSILNNQSGAILSVSNSNSTQATSTSSALRANTTSRVTVNNSGTMTFSAVNKSLYFGGDLTTFNNNSGGIVNVAQAITGGSSTLISTINNYAGASFNFNVATNSSTAINGKISFKNDGGTVTGRGSFADGTFVPMTGILSPGIGGISGVGVFDLQGADLSLTGTCVMNVNGSTTAGTDYDQIIYSTALATLSISGATLQVIGNAGYTPVAGDAIYLVYGLGTLIGPFAAVSGVPSHLITSYTTHAKLIYSAAAGIENLTQLNGKVYVHGKNIIVSLPSNEVAQLKVIDLNGKTLKETFVKGENNIVNVNSLSGVYIVRLFLTKGVYAQKVSLL